MNRTTGVLLYCILINIGLWAQQPVATIKFDSTDLLIGDEARGNIILNSPEGMSINFPFVTEYWKDKKFELKALSDQEVKNGDGGIQITTQNVVLIFWDTGSYQLPPLPFVYIKNNRSDTFFAEVPLIRVDFPAGITGDTAYVAPIKSIMGEAKTFWDYILDYKLFIFIFFGLIAVLVVGYLAIKIVRTMEARRKQLTPEGKALKELERLLHANFIDQKRFADYHEGISQIIREYLYNRFQLKAPQATTKDVLKMITLDHISDALKLEMKEVLETSDLVKFAKASPLDSANQFAAEYIRKLVDAVQEKLNNEQQ